MRSFLLNGKSPIVKWGGIPQNIFYEGEVPEGYSLAMSPSPGYIIIDVDRHGDKDGFDTIPDHIYKELIKTFHYPTKNNGMHFWVKYSGSVNLANRSSHLGIDLRTNKGYVVFYKPGDIRDYIHLIKTTSKAMNDWLESLFYFKQSK